MSAAEFDEFAESYDADLNQALSATGETKEFFARQRIEWLARCLRTFRGPKQSILDYGCGIGDSSVVLREVLQVTSYVGLDVSPRSLKRASATFGSADVRFFQFSEYLPQGCLDLAYCSGVFHHILVGERMAVVNYILGCLRPGGIFAFWENNPWNPGTRYVMDKCAFDRDALKVSPPEAIRLLRDGGFQFLGVTYQMFFPKALGALRFLDPLLSRVPLGGQYQVLARKPG